MALLVQKFGGSSVADADRILRCAQRVGDTCRDGHRVVVVVSAMGQTTDDLLQLASQLAHRPPRRELDQLLAAGEQVSIALMAMALQSLGYDAISLTGAQGGVLTDSAYTRARIRSIDASRVMEHLDRGRVVVVAGFQGVDRLGHTTTLGRGGSDTTAVALAAALHADDCEIFTDVPGVFTADPRIVPDARLIERISYEEMLELAWTGARVMAPRSVGLAMVYSVPVHVRHAISPRPGTRIGPEEPDMEHDAVTGVALKSDLGRVTLAGLPRGGDVQGAVFRALAEANLLVDDIIQNQLEPDTVTISFTVDQADVPDARDAMQSVLQELGRGSVAVDLGLAKISAIGTGMRTHTGVAATMFSALARAPGGPIRIQNITTSEVKISCIIDNNDGLRACQAVHDAFGLSRSRLDQPAQAVPQSSPHPA